MSATVYSHEFWIYVLTFTVMSILSLRERKRALERGGDVELLDFDYDCRFYS